MKLYLAGPMSGYPESNHPAFHQAAEVLRRQGHEVVNPAELDDTLGPLKVPEDYYLRDIPYLLQCDACCVLTGWQESRGATLEVLLMRFLKRPVYSTVPLSDLKDGVEGLLLVPVETACLPQVFYPMVDLT